MPSAHALMALKVIALVSDAANSSVAAATSSMVMNSPSSVSLSALGH
jgi:hypothetical protein